MFMIVLNTLVFEQKITDPLIYITAMYVLAGIFTTHLFREVIRHSGWLQLPVEKALPKFLIGVLLTCIACSLIRICAVDALGLVHPKKKPDFITELMATTSEYGLTDRKSVV